MLHSRSLVRAAAVLAMAGFLVGGRVAPATAAPPGPKDHAANTIDPAALAAVTRMGAAIAALNTFELTAHTTIEVALRGAHQVELGGTVHYFVKRLDRLRIDSETDTIMRQYFFDGKTFTVVAPADGYFAQAPGKPRADETLAFAAQTLDVEVPLADLLSWGTPTSPLKQFTRGFFVGLATIDGKPAEHYALIGRDLDLEIWLPPGDAPLPLKISLVDRRVKGNPRFSATLSWVTSPTFGDDVFAFTPGPNLGRIDFARPKVQASGKGGK